MKLMQDGFVYKVITPEKAKDVFAFGLFELYALWGDDSESLIDSYMMLNDVIKDNIEIGIAVGNIKN